MLGLALVSIVIQQILLACVIEIIFARESGLNHIVLNMPAAAIKLDFFFPLFV